MARKGSHPQIPASATNLTEMVTACFPRSPQHSARPSRLSARLNQTAVGLPGTSEPFQLFSRWREGRRGRVGGGENDATRSSCQIGGLQMPAQATSPAQPLRQPRATSRAAPCQGALAADTCADAYCTRRDTPRTLPQRTGSHLQSPTLGLDGHPCSDPQRFATSLPNRHTHAPFSSLPAIASWAEARGTIAPSLAIQTPARTHTQSPCAHWPAVILGRRREARDPSVSSLPPRPPNPTSPAGGKANLDLSFSSFQ